MFSGSTDLFFWHHSVGVYAFAMRGCFCGDGCYKWCLRSRELTCHGAANDIHVTAFSGEARWLKRKRPRTHTNTNIHTDPGTHPPPPQFKTHLFLLFLSPPSRSFSLSHTYTDKHTMTASPPHSMQVALSSRPREMSYLHLQTHIHTNIHTHKFTDTTCPNRLPLLNPLSCLMFL